MGLAVATLAAVSVLFVTAIEPHPPLMDRQAPEYLTRFAAAEKLNAINPGINADSLARILDTVPGVLEKLRGKYPSAPEHKFAAAKAEMERSLAANFNEMRADHQSYWAAFFSVEDIDLVFRLKTDPDQVPFLPTLVQRLRVKRTHTRSLPAFRRMMEGLAAKIEHMNKEMALRVSRLMVAELPRAVETQPKRSSKQRD